MTKNFSVRRKDRNSEQQFAHADGRSASLCKFVYIDARQKIWVATKWRSS